MLNVFYIHSSITEILAHAVIAHKAIEKRDVIFLFNRGYEPYDNSYKSYRFIYSTHEINHLARKNLFVSWRKYFSFKKYIKTVTADRKYYAYIPQTYRHFFNLMINQTKCVGFSIIEEGSDSYYMSDKLQEIYPPLKQSFWHLIGYFNKIKDIEYYSNLADNFIGITPYAFPDYPRRMILDIDLLSHDTDIEIFSFDNCHIIALDADSIHGFIPLNKSIKALKKVIQYIYRNYGIDIRLYYKMHPAQLDTEEEGIFDVQFKLITNGKAKRLPNNVSLELLAKSSAEVYFYTGISSVSMYTKWWGKKVYSYINLLVDECPEYSNRLNLLPEILFKDVPILTF